MMLLKNPFALLNKECYPLLDIITNIKNKFKTANGGKRMTQTPTSHGDTARINQTIRRRMLEIFGHIRDAADTSKVNSRGHRLPCYSINRLCKYINSALAGLKRYSSKDNNILVWDGQNNCLSSCFIDLLKRSGLADFSKNDAFVNLFRIMYGPEYDALSSGQGQRVRRATSARRSELRFLDNFPERINALLVADGVYHNFLQCVTGTGFNHSEYLYILQEVRAKVFDPFLRHKWSFDTLHAETKFTHNVQARLRALEMLGVIRSAHDSLKEDKVSKAIKRDYFRDALVQRYPQRWIVLKEIKDLNPCDGDADVRLASVVITQIFSTGNPDLIPVLNKLLGPRSTEDFYIHLKEQWKKLGEQLPCNHEPLDNVSLPHRSYQGTAAEVAAREVTIREDFKQAVAAGIMEINVNKNHHDEIHRIDVWLNVPSHILCRHE